MSLTVVKTQTPIKIAGTTSANQLIFDRPIFIKFVYWYYPTTVGHLFALRDELGREISTGRCETNGQSQILPVYAKYNQLYCDDLDSGTLYIYVE